MNATKDGMQPTDAPRFTPGEWKQNPTNYRVIESYSAGRSICEVEMSCHASANAALIAAAPDLLAALRGALKELVTPKGLPEVGKGRTTAQQAALNAARAAIARAEGK